MARSGRAGQPHAVRRSADPAPEEVSGLPRDARPAEGPRRDHRRHAGSHARGDRVERDGRRQARLRAEADVLVGARGPAPGEEGQREEGRRAAGQSAAFRRREPPVGRIHPGRRDRRRPRGARLDQPAVRLLAARRAAAGRGGRPAADQLGRSRHVVADRGGDEGRPAAGTRSAQLGPVPRRRPAGRVSPGLSPLQLARLGRLGPGSARRHGSAPHRLPGLVAGPAAAVGGRNRVDAVQRRVLPGGDHDLLRIQGERRRW